MIAGGTNATLGEIPYIASITLRDAQHCGGTLINKDWVITAAHCFNFVKYSDTKYILGRTNVLSQTGGSVVLQENVFIHPNYSNITGHNDIAMVKLSRSVSETENIKYAIIHEGNDLQIGMDSTVSGWGRTLYSDPNSSSENLQTATIQIQTPSKCQLTTEEAKNNYCAFSENPHRYFCLRDSGGPLIWKSNNTSYLVGVIASSNGNCSVLGSDGIYTKVSSYASWIKPLMSVCFGKNSYDKNVCSEGQGVCISKDTCKCHPPFFGNQCEKYPLPSEGNSIIQWNLLAIFFLILSFIF
eukprot:gene11005-3711_t